MLGQTKAFHFGSISLIAEPSCSATLEALKEARVGGALISFDVNYRPTLWEAPAAARERIEETIPLADVIKVNEVELALLTAVSGLGKGGASDTPSPGRLAGALSALDRGSQSLLSMGPRLCVVTLGREGSYFSTRQGGGHVPGFQVETVDATGCGDAFVAGLLWQLVGHGVWREPLDVVAVGTALRYANAVGALTSLTRGVIPALPTAAQVATFLSSQT
jgi:fructokinase